MVKVPHRLYLSCLLYTSNTLLFFHGGGWVTESIDTYNKVCDALARAARSRVISVEYRLAPEHPFPQGLDDCYAAARELFVRPKSFGFDLGRVTVIGDSAGGNLAAAVSLRARDEGEFYIPRQILIYPATYYDHSESSPFASVMENGSEYLLTSKRICEYIDLYKRDDEDLKNPYFAPLLAKDFSDQPDTLIITAEFDPLRDCLLYTSGQTVGVLGGTGSAKTTLVQLIPRLYDASRGTVRVGGRDVRDYDLRALRDAVGIVLQKNVLFSGTIRENLLWGNPEADDDTLWEACRKARADEFIERLPKGMDTDLGQGGVNVSGGQKQRLCIARTLLKKPKVLIFDDSTSAVDTATEGEIREALAKLTDVTKIIIAQRITSVMDTDQIIILDDGRIHGTGTHRELLEKDSIYQEDVYKRQTRDNGVRINPSLFVLRRTTMPAALVELAYLSNWADAQKLREDQWEFAWGIYQGLLSYFGFQPLS